MRRIALLAAAVALALACACAPRPGQPRLPDIGSSAGEMLTPAGGRPSTARYTLCQLRRYGYVLEDPLIDAWLRRLGHRLAAAAATGREQPFTFFMMRDRADQRVRHAGRLHRHQRRHGADRASARTKSPACWRTKSRTSPSATCCARWSARRRTRCRSCWRCSARSSPRSRRGGNSERRRAIAGRGDRRPGADAAAPDRLHAHQRIRSRPHRHPDPGARRLRPDGMADFFERMEPRHARQSRRLRSAPDYLQHAPGHHHAHQRGARPRRRSCSAQAGAASPADAARQRQPAAALRAAPPAHGGRAAAAPAHVRLGARAPARAQRRRRPAQAHARVRALRRRRRKASDAQRYGLALAQISAGYPAAARATLAGAGCEAHPGNLWLDLALAEANAARGKARCRRRALRGAAAQPSRQPRGQPELRRGADRARRRRGRQARARPCCVRCWPPAPTTRCSRRPSRAPANWPATWPAPARPTPRRPTSTAAPKMRSNQLNALLKRDDLDYYPARPDRGAHRRDHARGAGHAAPGHPRRGPAAATERLPAAPSRSA